MITLLTVNNRIDEITKGLEISIRNRDVKEVKRKTRELEQLKTVKFYLESNPKEDHIKESLNTVKTRITGIESRYNTWCSSERKANDTHTKLKARFNSEMGINKMNQQAEMLQFILSV